MADKLLQKGAIQAPLSITFISSEFRLSDISAADETGQRLRHVMGAVFGIDASKIGPDASSATVAEWDSVRHLQLMLALEEEFNVQFDTDELVSLRTLPLIERRLRTETT